jgi:putative hydrolase of the HAD superfamily
MTNQRPEFIYFDMGNVLVTFDEARAIRQIADASGVAAQRVREILFDSGLQRQYEEGRVTAGEVYETFCRESGTQPDFDALEHAASNMFELNVPIIPLLVHLDAAEYRLGILSNTCHSHWQYVRSRFRILRLYFDPVVLSYEVGAMKPAERIFATAIERAGVAAERIFYTDDRMENVEAARGSGLDAVQFTSVPALAAELRQRGIFCNY